MRLTCDVEISNRLLPSFNMRGKSRPVRSQVSVGRKPGAGKDGEVFVMICSNKDRNGAKYKLKGNIEQYFVKFIHQGKATIRFSEPPHDVCISKCDPLQLKGFLSVTKLGQQGSPNLEKVTLSSLAPVCNKQVENLRTKMTILHKKDYPITTGFPTSLMTLQVTGCNLKRFDNRMLKLRNLTSLNLSDNMLSSVPEDFSCLSCLAELHLANNHLSHLPPGFCTGELSQTLTLLDISRNKFKFFRPYFCQLQALVTLKIDENELVCLPPGIGKLNRLRILTASKNKLCALPASFPQLLLDELDLFGNPFMEEGPETARDRLHDFLSLQELTARYIKKHRIPHQVSDLPGSLIDYLETSKPCLCGSCSFQSFVHYLTKLSLHRITSSVMGVDASGRTDVPVEAFLCSRQCFERYRKNPYATMWK